MLGVSKPRPTLAYTVCCGLSWYDSEATGSSLLWRLLPLSSPLPGVM